VNKLAVLLSVVRFTPRNETGGRRGVFRLEGAGERMPRRVLSTVPSHSRLVSPPQPARRLPASGGGTSAAHSTPAPVSTPTGAAVALSDIASIYLLCKFGGEALEATELRVHESQLDHVTVLELMESFSCLTGIPCDAFDLCIAVMRKQC